jgi:hypothetical protein
MKDGKRRSRFSRAGKNNMPVEGEIWVWLRRLANNDVGKTANFRAGIRRWGW